MGEGGRGEYSEHNSESALMGEGGSEGGSIDSKKRLGNGLEFTTFATCLPEREEGGGREGEY